MVRRRLGVAMTGLLLVVAASQTTAGSTSAESVERARAPASAAPDCGPSVPRAGGGTWTCVLADDFSGDTLDEGLWSKVTSDVSVFRAGPECYLGDGDDIEVAQGVLRLTARAQDEEFGCHSANGVDYRTRYTGASVTTYGKFSTTYGRVEIRAAFPDTTVAGMHGALWLWPPAMRYGLGATGEMDIGEFYSVHPDRVIPFLHYLPAAPDGTNTNNYCFLDDPATFHDYVIEWQPGHVLVQYDGETCVDHTVAPAPPLSGSQPFDQPYSINLTQGFGITGNAFDPDTTPLPATLRVDHVRVWH